MIIKNKLFLVYLLFLVITKTTAQEIHFTHEAEGYYSLINSAELLITKQEYHEAISYYEKAFTLLKRPKGKDLYNKAVCYKKIGEENSANSIFSFLHKHNYELLSGASCFDTTIIQSDKPKQEMINGYNLDVIFQSILDEDQKVNPYKYTNFEKHARMIVENAMYIKKLATEIEDMFSYYQSGKLFFPILHYYELFSVAERIKSDSLFKKRMVGYRVLENIDFNFESFDSLIKFEVSKGNYDRDSYATLLNYRNIYFGQPIIQYDKYIIVRSPNVLCEEELNHINNNRRMLGLETYEEFFEKSRFIDSLITKGKPFTVLDFTEYEELLTEFLTDCNFDLARNYRKIFGFSTPEDAKRVYERNLEKLCPK